MGVNLTAPDAPTRDGAGALLPWMRRAAWLSLGVNILIVVTGGVVRLTASGLGCPTWPRCTDSSFVPHRELGVHGAIEFSNRMVTFLLVAVAVATLVLAIRVGRRSLTRLALVLALGVPAQAVIGGVTVLTDLNPWIVAFHLLVSIAMIGVAVALVQRVDEGDGPAVPLVSDGVTWLVRATFVAAWAVLRRHRGDRQRPARRRREGAAQRAGPGRAQPAARRPGLPAPRPDRRRGAGAARGRRARPARRAAVVLLVVELAQGVVGFVQYFTGLPVAVVALHLLGAALLSAAVTWLLLTVRERA